MLPFVYEELKRVCEVMSLKRENKMVALELGEMDSQAMLFLTVLDIVNEFKQGAWGDRYQTLSDCMVTIGLYCTVIQSLAEEKEES